MINMSKISTKLTDDILDSFVSMLTEATGIVPRSTHRDGIKKYIETKLSESKLTVDEYIQQLKTDKILFSEFINQSTVNETYFFREEKQFTLLKEKIFPQWRITSPDKDIKIWSAACSYGEEAYSLAVLALSCGIKPCVTASDINSKVLDHCKNGVFLGTSLRSVDGVAYQKLVLPYRREDGKIEFKDNIKKYVTTKQFNLSELDSIMYESSLPQKQNLVFLRNVFIYFTPELRHRILKTIAERCLDDDGYLFVSISEIAQLDSTIVPDSLEKVMDGNIFYLHKKCKNTGGNANVSNFK